MSNSIYMFLLRLNILYIWFLFNHRLGYLEGLPRINAILVITRLGSTRYPIFEVVVTGPRLEPRTQVASKSQEIDVYPVGALFKLWIYDVEFHAASL